MLKCKVQFWDNKEVVFEKEIIARNISELNDIAFNIAKENKMKYSLVEIKEIKDV